MHINNEYQELVNFFSDRELPEGPQHINAYSVFLNLPGAVNTHLQQLHSEVEATHKSAASLLCEVKEWLVKQSSNQSISFSKKV